MNRELLENVFVTALEGSSNYWYLISESTNRKIRNAVPRATDPYFSTAMLSAILDHGVEVDINDAENEDEVLGTLKVSTMEERLRLLADDPSYNWALRSEEDGEGDAETSDIVFQYLVIGEVWFS